MSEMGQVSDNPMGGRVRIQGSRQRTSVRTDFAQVIRSGTAKTAHALGNLAGMAGPAMPGATVVGAAINGVGSLVDSGGGGATAPNAAGLGGTGTLAGGGGLGGATLATSGGGGIGGGSVAGVSGGTGAGSGVNSQMAAMQQMQEMNQSFNLSYLELQNKTQNDQRQFQVISNIMKVKHDTAKNSIQNMK